MPCKPHGYWLSRMNNQLQLVYSAVMTLAVNRAFIFSRIHSVSYLSHYANAFSR